MNNLIPNLKIEVTPEGLRQAHDEIGRAIDRVKKSREPGRAFVHDALIELSASVDMAAELLELEPNPELDAALGSIGDGRTLDSTGQPLCAFCGAATPAALAAQVKLCCWRCGSVFPKS